MPEVTDLAKSISATLRERGFKFVGPIMMYALMQQVGMVNDHTVDCLRHAELCAMQATMTWPC